MQPGNPWKSLSRLRDDESGAVTVDWVVLTASIVGLGIAVGTSVWSDSAAVTGEISGTMRGVESRAAFPGGDGGSGGDDGGDGGGTPVTPTDPDAPAIPASAT